ncbi:MAG: PDZ domain-containing protein [Kofleriaceae bacterium]|nr:PDZ domain-containing protein [Kofleriaceae bacterium]
MRWLGFLAVLFAASSASAAPASNPSFLGITMNSIGAVCVVADVTNCSPAQDAGLRFGDAIVAIDGKALFDGTKAPCDELIERITAHAPGDVTSFDIRRGDEAATIRAVLSTRADVQHRCLVDQPIPSIEVTDLDDQRTYSLDEVRGTTTVIGWFPISKCSGCSKVFDLVSEGLAKKLGAENARVLGMTLYELDVDENKKLPTRKGTGFSSTVPLAAASVKDYEELSLREMNRVQFMVVDSRGIVRFVAPIAPDSDDVEAAVDEVLAAAQQAEHARTQRR